MYGMVFGVPNSIIALFLDPLGNPGEVSVDCPANHSFCSLCVHPRAGDLDLKILSKDRYSKAKQV